ncbi:MAG: hypothetical protein KIG61_05050, partial [Muribaculaceae bacterium]|nr:hypothetical protein [Muribaculaceae bacterium]
CLAGSAILFNANAVEREYTQFTAFQTSGSETIIPDGKYIMIAPNSNSKCYCMNPFDKISKFGDSKNYGVGYVDASYTSSNTINVSSDYEVTIQRTSNNTYSLIASNGQFLYSSGNLNLELSSSNGAGAWTLQYEPGDNSDKTDHSLKFSVSDRSIKFRNTSGDFTALKKQAIGDANRPYPTIYTAVPAAFAVKGVTGANETTLSNGGTFYVLIDNSSSSKVNFNADGAYKIDYTVAGSTTTVMGDTFDYPVPTSTGETTITVTPYDANGKAYTDKSFTVTINVGNAPCLGEFFQYNENEDNSYDVTLTQSDATGVNLRTYTIDGNSTAADQSDGALQVSNVNLSKARFIVTASNNFLSGQVFEYNFINLLNNALGAGTSPYQACIVYTNNSKRFTEGYPQSVEIPMTPNSDYTQWTCDLSTIKGLSGRDILGLIPWIATEFKIELKIVPRDSNTPMILSGKGMSVAEMPGRNREAAAKISAQDSSAYSFVVDGGAPLIYNAKLSADESTYNMIAGSAKFEPFVTNSITLSHSSNIETGISDINPDANEAEYYNLQGIRVDNPQQGIYIRRQGNKTTKVIL